MRLHISLDDSLVEQLDERVGKRRRSMFIGETLRRALEDDQRWQDIEAGLGALAENGNEWSSDPAAWITAQRYADSARVG